MTPPVRLVPGDLTHPAVLALIAEHLSDMARESPPESIHALDLTGLQDPGLEFWAAWRADDLLGCGALQELTSELGEIKTMRTAPAARGQGVGALVLSHLLARARARGFRRVSLETGTQAYFAPAQRMYARAGFVPCPPFGSYGLDPNSAFLTREV